MGLLLVVIMFGLIAIGMPVTFTLGLSSLFFFLVNGIPLGTFAQKLAMSVDSFPLLALPFFILAGNLMNTGGITRRLFTFSDALLGNIRGGITYVSILSGMLFSAMSGSSIANAAGLGTIQIKAMEERGYDKEFAACLVSAVSVLGPIIPPSVIMIVYGITANVSISKMFIGGIIPGVMLSGMYALLCWYYGRKLGFPRGEKFNLRIVWSTFREAVWALLAPLIILVGIFSGIFTATESGAVACLYTLIVGVLVYKDLTWKDLLATILDSGKTTGTILLVSATGALFGFCLTYARVPQALAALMVQYIASPYALLLILTFVYIILGCLMAPTAIVITTVPIFVPLCKALGIDLIYFGVLVGILMSVGTITPPVGTVMFIICRNTGISIERFSKIMLPWFALIALFTLLLIFFPQIVTILPKLAS